MMFPKPSFPWLEQTLADLHTLAEQTQSRIAATMSAVQDTATHVQQELEHRVQETWQKVVPPEVQSAVATNHVLVNQLLNHAQDRATVQLGEVQKLLLHLDQERAAMAAQVTVRIQAVIPAPRQLQTIGGGMVGLLGGHVVGSALGGVAGAVTLGPVGAVIGTQVGGFTGRVVGSHLGESLAGGQPLETADERMQRLASDYLGSSLGATVGTVVGQVTLGPLGAVVGNFVGDALGGQLGVNAYEQIKRGQAPADQFWAIDHAGETTSEFIGSTLGRLVAGAQGQMYGARLGVYFGRKMSWQQAACASPDLSPAPELCYPQKETQKLTHNG